MMLVRMLALLFVFVSTGLAEELRTCYKCRVKNKCKVLDPTSVEVCRPDVHHCIKKTTVSKVTGASVTERYCGGRDFLDISADLVENRCYTDDIRTRTTATICYCSTDFCNAGHRTMLSKMALLSAFVVLVML